MNEVNEVCGNEENVCHWVRWEVGKLCGCRPETCVGETETMPRKVYSSLKPASPQASSLSPQTTEFDISQKTEGIFWGKSGWISKSQLIIFPKKLFLSFRMLKYILFGLLPLLSVNGVVGEHRIKLEKGYNMQERPASEKEGEPLEIKSVGFLNCSHCHWFKWQTGSAEFYLILYNQLFPICF